MLQAPGVLPRVLCVDFFAHEGDAVVVAGFAAPGSGFFGESAAGVLAVEKECGGEEGEECEQAADGDGGDESSFGDYQLAAV